MQLLSISPREVLWSTVKKTTTEGISTTYISESVLHLTFHAKSHDKVLLLNFQPDDIKVNESALEEVVQMRNESLFSWQKSLIELNGISMYLFKLRSWNSHLEHFLSDKIYSTYFSLFCFTETNINDSSAKHIDNCHEHARTFILITINMRKHSRTSRALSKNDSAYIRMM